MTNEEIIINKLETIEEKEDTIIGILNAHTTAINSILTIVNELSPSPTPSPDEDEDETTSQFKTELKQKIDEGIPYDQVKEWIIQTLTEQGIYSEEDIVIKIFTDIKGNIIFEVKSKPFIYWGKLLQFLQDSMGDADKFETSRYTMRVIEWWNLTENMQIPEQENDSGIVDEVNEQWGDKDNVFGK